MNKKLLLIICMLGTICLSRANNLISNDGIPILASNTYGDDRSASFSADINGHNLTVSFLESLGNVNIEIENVAGIVIEYNYVETPSGYLYYIPLAGRYTITFTLSNGDKYYGEFEVDE